MAIKNYTTKVSTNRSIQEIQDALIKHGAIGFLLEYEKDTGRIQACKFLLQLNENKIPFALPVNWRRFQAVLKEQRIKRWSDEDYCYRVAWRCIRDWVLAQLALYETEMAQLPQVFLPYAMDKNGVSTLYDRVLNNNLLSEGK
jgi:hypothetical protein